MKRKFLVAGILCGALTLGIGMSSMAADYEGYTQEEFDALTETTVIASEDSITGYYVTFRFPNDNYYKVQIYGEWAFTDPDYTTMFYSMNLTPDEWQDGYTCYGNWQTADMELNESTDTWVYTIPLPNGTYNYRFTVYTSEDDRGTNTYDPNNIPFRAYEKDVSDMTNEELLTSVYVPWDEVKQANTIKVEEEAPRDGENGEVLFNTVTLEDGKVTSYGIYLPYGFDVNREEPYPILVLYHGGGGYEASWLNNGLANIMDNMIAEGRVEPMVVVTPNGENFKLNTDASLWDRAACWNYVVDTILPYMEENYNVSSDSSRHAAAGLSQGGATLMHAYFNFTDYFDYYICMSAPYREGVYMNATKNEKLKDVNLYIGHGLYDSVNVDVYFNSTKMNGENSIYYYMYNLSQAGLTYQVNETLPYGHQWTLWRQLLVDVLDNFLWQ